MSDVDCPYCGAAQEINHDDGYGYEEDRDHEQDCVDCGKEFKFTTGIMYCYQVKCDEAVQPHEWEDWDNHEVTEARPMFQGCKNCEACRRKPREQTA